MTDLFDVTPSDDNARDELLNKWKDKPVEEVLKAKVEADLHIKNLEREKAEMYEMYKAQHEELLAKAKFEEYIDQMRKPPETPVALPPANSDTKPFDPNEIKELLRGELSLYETQKREQENFGKVQSKLRERFGDNYASVLKDQQINLGLSAEDVNSLAKKSPEAFFKMLGLNETQHMDYQTPPRNSQRNDNFAPKTVRRDWAYYQNLKKTNPMLYLDPKISAQMERDAQELGSAFGLPPD
jgi:hypothetical protein